MSVSENRSTAIFRVRAAAEPQAMPRLLELFALRSLVPERWHAERAGAELHILIEVPGLRPMEGEHLAARMRQLVPVRRVLMQGTGLARSA